MAEKPPTKTEMKKLITEYTNAERAVIDGEAAKTDVAQRIYDAIGSKRFRAPNGSIYLPVKRTRKRKHDDGTETENVQYFLKSNAPTDVLDFG